MDIERKLAALGLVLPAAIRPPQDVALPFAWARVHGDRVHLAGHGPQNADASAPLTGRLGAEVSASQGYDAARSATVSMLASLKRAVGDLDRVAAWLSVTGFVHVAPGFVATTAVINGCSDLLLDLYGPEVGMHARSAIGGAQLPMDLPVILCAEVALHAP